MLTFAKKPPAAYPWTEFRGSIINGNETHNALLWAERGGEYLMLHRTKKENDENRDKWIGVGGKFEPGESPEDCLRREVREETGLTLTRWRYRGLVTFVSDVWPCEYMHLFTADAWTGEQCPCDEGEAAWIGKDEPPQKKLWAGDRIFSSPACGGRAVFSRLARLPRRRADRRRAKRQKAARPRIKRAECQMHPRGEGLCSAHRTPNIPRRRGIAPKARARKTCPFRALRISRISPLCQKRPAPVENIGAGRFTSTPLVAPRDHPPQY